MPKEYADLKHERRLPVMTVRRLRLLRDVRCACGSPATGLYREAMLCLTCRRAARLDAEIERQQREAARMRG